MVFFSFGYDVWWFCRESKCKRHCKVIVKVEWPSTLFWRYIHLMTFAIHFSWGGDFFFFIYIRPSNSKRMTFQRNCFYLPPKERSSVINSNEKNTKKYSSSFWVFFFHNAFHFFFSSWNELLAERWHTNFLFANGESVPRRNCSLTRKAERWPTDTKITLLQSNEKQTAIQNHRLK